VKSKDNECTDHLFRKQQLNNSLKKNIKDNMKSCWVQSQEKIRVYENGMVETQDGAISIKGYSAPHYPVYTSTPTPMYEKFPKILVKKLDPSAIVPTKANSSDAGYDLYATEDGFIHPRSHKLVKTGISMAIPEGYAGLIWPRSGLSYKNGLDVLAGVIDSGYRGDVGVILLNTTIQKYEYNKGDRIAQIVIQKVEDLDLIEVEDLDSTDRGAGGFGSSGV
jgi:dUTP pyrophosphatase